MQRFHAIDLNDANFNKNDRLEFQKIKKRFCCIEFQ